MRLQAKQASYDRQYDSVPVSTEWNKYKHYQNLGVNPPVASQQAGNGPPITTMRATRSDSLHDRRCAVCLSVCLSVTDRTVCLGLLPRMAAVPSDNAHAATPHHLRNKGPHASTQSPPHHTSWTAPSNSCPLLPWLAASLERASGSSGRQGDLPTRSVTHRGAARDGPLSARSGLPACEPDCRSATRRVPGQDLGPALV